MKFESSSNVSRKGKLVTFHIVSFSEEGNKTTIQDHEGKQYFIKGKYGNEGSSIDLYQIMSKSVLGVVFSQPISKDNKFWSCATK